MRPATAFERPAFPLIPDAAGVRDYGNVSNLLEIEGAEDTQIPIVIPTSLFLMMKDILKIDPTASAFLYLAQEGPYFVFGIGWGAVEYCDLWLYSEKTLPAFIRTAVVV